MKKSARKKIDRVNNLSGDFANFKQNYCDSTWMIIALCCFFISGSLPLNNQSILQPHCRLQ